METKPQKSKFIRLIGYFQEPQPLILKSQTTQTHVKNEIFKRFESLKCTKTEDKGDMQDKRSNPLNKHEAITERNVHSQAMKKPH